MRSNNPHYHTSGQPGAADNSWSTTDAPRQASHVGMNQTAPVGYAQAPPPPPPPPELPPGSASAGGVQSFELEPNISSTSKGSWMQRVPWLRSKEYNVAEDRLDYGKHPGEGVVYYGGQMAAESSSSRRMQGASHDKEAPPPEQARSSRPLAHAVGFSPVAAAAAELQREPYSFQSVASWLTASSRDKHHNADGDDSLVDFDESEWTQPDSSYGAAIPVGGWIPKKIRRMIESTLIAVLVVALVYMVVATSIRVTEGRAKDSNSTDYGGLNLDDDRYIDYTDDAASGYAAVDDAYSSSGYAADGDAYSGGGGDDDNDASGYGGGNANNNNGGGDDAYSANNDDAYGGRRLFW